MKRNLLTIGLIALSFQATAQVICHVDQSGLFYVGENALVYNGGGVQTKGDGRYDVHGNVMVVGDGTAAGAIMRTLNSDGTTIKKDGGNFILRLNDAANYATSTYGQLYIDKLAQASITATVDKEYRTAKHGTYQQIALPFYNKRLYTLSGSTSTMGTLGKTFTNVRWSKNEVLIWNNAKAVSDNWSVNNNTSKATSYYMLGSANFSAAAPPTVMPVNAPAETGSVYTLKGVPFASGITELLTGAAAGINFGTTGNAKNSYGELYNSYLQDVWDYGKATNPWSYPTYGRNMYQFGNPYFTNLDLALIGYKESGVSDGNAITSIQGIRYDPGTVLSRPDGSTYTTTAQFVNFTAPSTWQYGTGVLPVGDIGLVIKPMQTFVIKLKDNDPQVGTEKTLNFDNLRRFNYKHRSDGTDYSVTASKGATSSNTLKQLGVIALNANGQEVGRTYYVVYPDAITGYTTQATTQSTLGVDDAIGTFEEDPVNGGYDMNQKDKYWLYINEANETDFLGKAVPLAIYSNKAPVASLKFEIRENTKLIGDGEHNLSTGIGFYYKASNGEITEVAQNQIIPVTSDQYNLYYGKSNFVLGTGDGVKPSRTRVLYNKAIDSFIVHFDASWNKAEINVYDMSGKLIISQKNVATGNDYVLDLSKVNNAYIVTAVSEKGEKVSTKIIR